MSKSKSLIVCAGFIVAGLFPAFAADENGLPGTVNYFTAPQKARAFKAAADAGYNPTVVEAFQDGNFFLTATKGGQNYEVTVLPTGKVYASEPITATS